DSPSAPSDRQGTLTGRGLYVNNTDLSPVSSSMLQGPACCFALLCIAEQYKAACLYNKTAHS
ncbi:unnamed protein product, partial [Staurois parvus]